MKKIILTILAAILLVVIVVAAWQRHFIYRAYTYPHHASITSADWYEPLAPVPGSQAPRIANSSRTETIFGTTLLDSLKDYAAATATSALLVGYQDSLVLEWYAETSGPQARTNSQSMVKSIVALLVGVALEKQWIQSIEDPAADYLPEFADDDRRYITIRHLLEMSSGLLREDSQTDPFSDLVQLYLGQDANGTALAVPAAGPPGQKFDYNNANTQLLGIILQRQSGLPFITLLSQYLWKPIGGTDAGIWLDEPGGDPRVFCCFFTTARDWLRVGGLFLHEGEYNGNRVVSPDWVRRIVQRSPTEPDYGLHTWLGYEPAGRHGKFRSEPYAAPDVYYLAGQDHQKVYVIPSAQLVIVRVGELPDEWDDVWIPNRLIRAVNRFSLPR